MFGIIRQTFRDFGEDEGTRLAAALSYFTVFSIPPLLMLAMTIVGAVWNEQDVERMLAGQAGEVMGPAGRQLREIMRSAERPDGSRGLAGIIGVAGLLIGATGAFIQLQGALNRIWEVKPDPAQGGVRRMFFKRIFSLGMILTLGFLLLVSMLLTTVVEAFGDALSGLLPPPFSGLMLTVITLGFSFLVITTLFAVMFKYMPDAIVSWRDVRVGAVVTALLFLAGKYALEFYLGRSNPGSAFGAAGSLALLLLWIYYAAIIVFIGAEFTQAWARGHGRDIVPEPGAVRITEATSATSAPTAAEAAPPPRRERRPAPPPSMQRPARGGRGVHDHSAGSERSPGGGAPDERS